MGYTDTLHSEVARKKSFSGLQRDSPCSALPAKLWRPIHWRQANLLSSSTHVTNETQNEMDAEATGSNPVEAPKIFFCSGYFAIA